MAHGGNCFGESEIMTPYVRHHPDVRRTPYCIPLASRFRGTGVCLHLSACSSSYALATPDKFATKPSANGTQFGVVCFDFKSACCCVVYFALNIDHNGNRFGCARGGRPFQISLSVSLSGCSPPTAIDRIELVAPLEGERERANLLCKSAAKFPHLTKRRPKYSPHLHHHFLLPPVA